MPSSRPFRLRAAFGPIEGVEVLGTDPAGPAQRFDPVTVRTVQPERTTRKGRAKLLVTLGAVKRRCPGRRRGQMAGTDGGRLHGLVDDQTVYAALDAIDEALEQALTAPTERQQRWQLNQLRGLLLTLHSSNLSLEEGLRRLIRLLRTPMVDR
jgi:hypothetical protein